jgi:hypothetical protein
VNTGQLIPFPNLPVLANSIWQGTLVQPNGSFPLSMRFISGGQVQVTMAGRVYNTGSYQQSPSGVAFRTVPEGVYNFFGIIVSGNEMKGTLASPDNQWNITKQ